MAFQTPKGFYVWDRPEDPFKHDELAANWVLLDQLLGEGGLTIGIVSSLPTTNLFPGRLIQLNANDGGFMAWTVLRFDGTAWRPLGPFEIQPSLPTQNNWDGRLVVLSTSSGGFSAWDVCKYYLGSWHLITASTGIWGLERYTTGDGPLNIKGLKIDGDLYFSDPFRGPILVDRVTGVKRRLFFSAGQFSYEVVT